MTTTKSQYLEEIRARVEKATPGYWQACGLFQILVPREESVDTVALFDEEGFEHRPEDINFISHARTDIPALLQIIEKQAKAFEDVDKDLCKLITVLHETNPGLACELIFICDKARAASSFIPAKAGRGE